MAASSVPVQLCMSENMVAVESLQDCPKNESLGSKLNVEWTTTRGKDCQGTKDIFNHIL